MLNAEARNLKMPRAASKHSQTAKPPKPSKISSPLSGCSGDRAAINFEPFSGEVEDRWRDRQIYRLID